LYFQRKGRPCSRILDEMEARIFREWWGFQEEGRKVLMGECGGKIKVVKMIVDRLLDLKHRDGGIITKATLKKEPDRLIVIYCKM
jgi:hypothetical protein